MNVLALTLVKRLSVCHPERSEGFRARCREVRWTERKVLRCAQDDTRSR
ncbi:MAG: hypothetical protein OJF58_004323 [Enhydrobacter sp.]|nr:MAG: hypothetical protein OJF58_004323 [Enhydrobacter sp.]